MLIFMIDLQGMLVLQDEINLTPLTITKLQCLKSYFHPLYKSWNISDDFPDIEQVLQQSFSQ